MPETWPMALMPEKHTSSRGTAPQLLSSSALHPSHRGHVVPPRDLLKLPQQQINALASLQCNKGDESLRVFDGNQCQVGLDCVCPPTVFEPLFSALLLG